MKRLLLCALTSIIMLTLCVSIYAADAQSFEFSIQAVRKIVGESFELTILPTPADAQISVTYTSENGLIAEVDANGKVTAVGAGDTYIVATAGDLEAKCHVFVYEEALAPVDFVAIDYNTSEKPIVTSIGDSITAYTVNGTVGNTQIQQGYNYHEWWAKSYHLKTNDYGWGGSKVSETECSEPSFIDRYEDMIAAVPNANLITVMGGTNDFGSTPLGDYNSRDLNTFAGAIKFLMEEFIEAYPNSQIVFFSPTRTYSSGKPLDYTNSYGDTKYDYAQATVDLAEIYGIHGIDLYSVDEIDFRSTDMLLDGVHPTKDGQKIMANVMAEMMEEVGAVDIKDPIILASGKCGDSLEFTVDHRNELIISGNGDMYNYSAENPAPWSSYKASVNKISISGATTIGAYAFDGFTAIKGMSLPSSVTSIGDNAFYGCSAITGVIVPSTVTAIGADAFGACSSLVSIVIPDSVTSIGADAFASCSASLTIRGYENSVAHTYANDSGITFEIIDTMISGDVDTDGKVNSVDVIKLARYLADWDGYDTINEVNSDVDADGEITVSDSAVLARHWAGWISYATLPYTK